MKQVSEPLTFQITRAEALLYLYTRLHTPDEGCLPMCPLTLHVTTDPCLIGLFGSKLFSALAHGKVA